MNLDELRKKRKISKEVKLKVLRDTGFQLGRILEKARTIKMKTQTELADEIDSTQSVIAKIENGSKLPSLPFLQRVADALETYLIPPKFGFMEEPKITIKIDGWDKMEHGLLQARATFESDKKETFIETNDYVTA